MHIKEKITYRLGVTIGAYSDTMGSLVDIPKDDRETILHLLSVYEALEHTGLDVSREELIKQYNQQKQKNTRNSTRRLVEKVRKLLKLEQWERDTVYGLQLWANVGALRKLEDTPMASDDLVTFTIVNNA